MDGNGRWAQQRHRPFEDTDIVLLIDALGEDGAGRALWQNAREFYRLS